MALLQVVLAEWNGYFLAKVIEEEPLRLLFAHESVTSKDGIEFTDKALRWNKNDEQLADKDYVVCQMPNDMITITKTGLRIVDEDECIEFLNKEISSYEH